MSPPFALAATASTPPLDPIWEAHATHPNGFAAFSALRGGDGGIIDFLWLYANPALERLCGRELASLRGKMLKAQAPVLELEWHVDTFIRVIEGGGPLTFELEDLDRQPERWLMVTVTPFRDGFAAWFQDATPTKRYEQRLLEMNERVSVMVDALQYDRSTLLREARTALRLREDFLSVASHELRTPLTTLNLYLHNLHRELEGQAPTGERGLKWVASAKKQVRRLTSLIDGLIDVARLTAGRLPFEPEQVDLAELLREVLTRHADELRNAGCSIELDAPGPVIGCWDQARVDQVATHLLSNAIKYGAGKPIHVSVGLAGSRATLAVRDHGIGIAARDLPRIFGKFERAVNAHDYSGLGLGLFVTREIVTAMGGCIEVSSEEGQGSTFTVELPLAPSEARTSD